ncbi:MAG: hypothetical protein KJ818_07260 [Candidatus Omnitrophica bacterium]|nr:hypothetical protein [Candidatus Omnitrophota bacterium]
MKNKTLRKIGLGVLVAGLIIGSYCSEAFADLPNPPSDLVSIFSRRCGDSVILRWQDNSNNEEGFRCIEAQAK